MHDIHVEAPEKFIDIFGGIYVPTTMISAFLATIVLVLLAALVRIFVIPKFKDQPGRFQMILEMAVDGVRSYTSSMVGNKVGQSLSPYIFTVALFLVINAFFELIGIRATMTDLNSTVALALITFILIQVYAIRKKGLWGRIKGFGKPFTALAPINLVTQLAIPVSLSCRLFGNILGGMIVMELLYNVAALRWGLPAFLSIYFTLFHTFMQTFIFITLSLTFIEESLD